MWVLILEAKGVVSGFWLKKIIAHGDLMGSKAHFIWYWLWLGSAHDDKQSQNVTVS